MAKRAFVRFGGVVFDPAELVGFEEIRGPVSHTVKVHMRSAEPLTISGPHCKAFLAFAEATLKIEDHPAAPAPDPAV